MQLLASHPEFSRAFEIRKYTNYLHEEVPAQELAECSLFMYQHLGAKWGDHASDELLAKVNSSATVMAVPNVLFKAYWPLWTNHSPMDFGDAYLDKLIDMGLEITRLCSCILRPSWKPNMIWLPCLKRPLP